MNWLYLVSYFFGGIFLANAIPHLVSGMMGRSFQSPFAKPPGKGLSSSTVNVLWGFGNLVVAYCLILRVGQFDLRAADHIASLGVRCKKGDQFVALLHPITCHFAPPWSAGHAACRTPA